MANLTSCTADVASHGATVGGGKSKSNWLVIDASTSISDTADTWPLGVNSSIIN